MKNILTAIFCFLPVVLFAESPVSNTPVYLDLFRPIEERVEDALSRMTLEEKVAMCHAQSKFSSAGVPRLGIPEIWMSDGPHGVREEIEWDSWNPAGWTNDRCTAFPVLTCLAASFDPDLSKLYGVAIGEEARYRKKDILLGPGVNIYRTPLNGRNFEYLGEDPFLASKIVVPYIKGVQSNGVSACVKHFALNNQETERDRIEVEVSDRALREIYLPAFRAAVQDGGVWAVMGAYNKYKGEHCCHNDVLLNQILKKEWGFDGVVVSDWGGAHDTKQSALNGLDIEMGSYTNGLTSGAKYIYNDYYLAKPFLDLLKKGEIPMSVLDDKVRRILRLEMRTNVALNRPFGRFVCEDHSSVARRVASEGIVLLKNEKNLLPIVPGRYRKIAVIGENATKILTKGGGSSELKTDYEVSPLEALTRIYGSNVIVHSMGYASGAPVYGRALKSPHDSTKLFNEAVETARTSDVVVFMGGLNKNYQQDCEGVDRVSYDLPFGQNDLLNALQKVNPKVVVVLLSGNAVSMPWLPKIPALLQGWFLGSESGNALADVLSGKVNPSGKLPFSFPKELSDNAAMSFGKASYPGESGKQKYMEDILVGYRWFDTKKIKPQFAFGYGMSYTIFQFGSPTVDRTVFSAKDSIHLSFLLKNVGTKDGAEVAQLYVSELKPSVFRPAKELKAFRKVFLKAGEEQLVTLSFKASDMSYYSDVTKTWKLDVGKYRLMLGASSAEIKESVEIVVK
jgi:beta-glucosidase